MNKLVIIDIKTGQVLNNDFKLNLIKYVHEFCNKQLDETTESSDKNTKSLIKEKINEEDEIEKINDEVESLEKEATVDEIETEKDDEDAEVENITNNLINFNLNFDFDNYEMYKKMKKKNGVSKKYIESELLKQLNENLIDVLTFEKQNYDLKIETNNETYYLLYFCSNFTKLNASLLESVIQFLKYMREKTKCNIKIVLISSDKLIDDYNQLVKRHQTETSEDNNNNSKFARLALDFNAKQIKEKLFFHLNVMGIPWISLINSNNGEILCENLKIFILNSQLREIIF